MTSNTFAAPRLDLDEAPRLATITASTPFDNPVRFTAILTPAPPFGTGFFPGLSRVYPAGAILDSGEVGQDLVRGLQYRLAGPTGNAFPALDQVNIELRPVGPVTASCTGTSLNGMLGPSFFSCQVRLGSVAGSGSVRVYIGGQFCRGTDAHGDARPG
ncbi:MAG: hypothetical protein K2X03_04465 [Bryobacteraceae bacterium]|nr:hypothetical protein [Bryobacteraceae bacterium]